MIHGIGSDIVEVSRIETALQKHGEAFAHKILNESEMAEFYATKYKTPFLAKRFAAKEAAAKALGTGFREGVTHHDIEISHDALGKPGLVLHGEANHICQNKYITYKHLTISDEKHYVLAFVILE